MSDFNSSLPVRTENPGDVIAKLSDATTPSQQLAISVAGQASTLDASDGPVSPGAAATFASLAAGQYNTVLPTLASTQQAAIQLDSSGRLIISPLSSSSTVTVDQGTSPWVISGTVTANAGTGTFAISAVSLPLPTGASTSANQTTIISDLATINTSLAPLNYAQGSTTASQLGNLIMGAVTTAAPAYTSGQTDPLSLTPAGALRVDGSAVTQPVSGTVSISGTVAVTQSTSPWITQDNHDENYGTVGATTLRTAAQIGNATGAADFNNGATDAQTLRVAANLAVAGANVTSLNPVPVTLVSSVAGTSVDDFKDASAIAAGSSDNHDYTVTAGKTLTLTQVESSASGKAKMTIQIETGVATNVFTTKFVQFNSTATPNMSIAPVAAISVAAGVRVRCIMMNNDLAAMDLYSTICGTEA